MDGEFGGALAHYDLVHVVDYGLFFLDAVFELSALYVEIKQFHALALAEEATDLERRKLL